jgi:hypothetical protein
MKSVVGASIKSQVLFVVTVVLEHKGERSALGTVVTGVAFDQTVLGEDNRVTVG